MTFILNFSAVSSHPNLAAITIPLSSEKINLSEKEAENEFPAEKDEVKKIYFASSKTPALTTANQKRRFIKSICYIVIHTFHLYSFQNGDAQKTLLQTALTTEPADPAAQDSWETLFEPPNSTPQSTNARSSNNDDLLALHAVFEAQQVKIYFYMGKIVEHCTRLPACASHSELNVDNWNDNCEAKSEAKRPRPLRGLQVDFSLTRDVSYAVR